MKGQIPWNKGLTIKDDSRIAQPWLGKKRSRETVEKIRMANSVDKIAFVCQLCGQTVFLKPYKTKKRKYCSRECVFVALRNRVHYAENRVLRTCAYCGKQYKSKKWLEKTSKYCSRLCNNKAAAELKRERAKVVLNCLCCGNPFTIKKSELQRNPKYCSATCFLKSVHLSESSKNKTSNSVKRYYNNNLVARQKLREYRLKQVIPSKDTYIEVALQNELNRRGITYEKHLPVLGICQPDIVFIDEKIAVFADGDYWHTKDTDVVAKDQFQNKFLRANGWSVLRFWEREIKENTARCVEQIEKAILHKNRNIVGSA
jgi:DNA mismatch endonuclease (patch repair protein)